MDESKNTPKLNDYDAKISNSYSSQFIGIWSLNLLTQQLFWDEGMLQLYEINIDKFHNSMNFWKESIYTDDKTKFQKNLDECIQKGKNIDFIFRVQLENSKIKFLQMKGMAQQGTGGKPFFISGINWDISSEFQMRNEQDKILKSLHKSSIVSIADIYGNISFANEKFCEISGYTLEELIGQNHKIINSGFHPKEFFKQLWKTIRSGNIWHSEICNKKKNGENYWVDSYIIPFKNKDNIIDQYVSIRYDITQRVLAEQKFALKMTSLGEMAGNIAHEINSPLSIITGRCEQIMRRLEQENIEQKSDIMEKINEIHLTTKRILKTIKSLRQFSRKSDNDPSQLENFSKILDDTLALCQEKFKNHFVELKLNGNFKVNINCRPNEIMQVLLNLLNNSLDAMENIEQKWIKIESEINNDENNGKKTLKVKIKDNGNLIPDEVALKIMQPFYTTKEVGKGTGMGLSISKGFIESHNGKLYLDRSLENTCFVIELPYENIII